LTMKKILAIVFVLSMMFTSCADCGCNSNSSEVVEAKIYESKVYRLYKGKNDYYTLRVYKYDTEDATIIQYYLSGETRNISIIPKVKETLEENSNAGIFEQENYFDF
jgi:hypothetical protein